MFSQLSKTGVGKYFFQWTESRYLKQLKDRVENWKIHFLQDGVFFSLYRSKHDKRFSKTL